MADSLIDKFMRGAQMLFLAVLFFSACFTTVSAEEIFTDGFESADFSSWDGAGVDWSLVKNSLGTHEGEYRAEGRGGVSAGSVIVKYISTAGYENIELSFWYQLPGSGFETGEDMDIDFTLDHGASWTNLKKFVDGDEVEIWTKADLLLPVESFDEVGFGIRFQTNSGQANDIFKVDTVSITGDTLPLPDYDNDGVIVGDYCPDTAIDKAGIKKLNPNKWRFDGSNWLQGLTKKGREGSKIFSMEDTQGCNCDQIINIFQDYTGFSYNGHRKYGCSQGLIEDFIDFVW